MSEELPEGWCDGTMGDIANVVGGGTPSVKDAGNFCEAGGHAWLTPADLSGYTELRVTRGARNLTEKGLRESSARLLPEGTVLMSSRAPIGYLAIAANEISTNQGFKSFVLRPGLEPPFILFWLRSINGVLQDLGSGSTFAEISGAKAKEIPARVAPLAEQRRIVEKVEALLEQVNQAKARLDRVRLILKKFRQSVLAAACSGELTREWRAVAGVPFFWSLTTLDEVCSKITDGEHLTPQTQSVGVPLLSAKDVRENGVDLSSPKYVSPASAHRFRQRCDPNHGDVLVVSRGATIGRTCVVQVTETFCLMGSVILMKPSPRILPRYLHTILASPTGQRHLGSLSGHSAQQAIYIRDIKGLEAQLPSVEEQAEIVRQVDALFSLASIVERRVQAATLSAEKLPQAILSKAFSGELVPTEAELARTEGRSYETAEELLKRVTASAAPAPANGKGRRPRAARKTA